MKKLLVLLLTLLLLTACGQAESHDAQVTGGNDVLFTVGKHSYTKADLNTSMKGNDYTEFLEAFIVYDLASLEGIDMSDAESYANTNLEYLSMYGESYMDYYGGEEVAKKYFMAEELIKDLANTYVEEHFDEMVNDYRPFYGQFAYFSTEEEAVEFLDKINNGSTFEMAAAEVGYTLSTVPDVYSDKSYAIPADLKEFALNNDAPAVSGISLVTTEAGLNGVTITSDRYYVLNIIDKDMKLHQDAFLEHLKNNAAFSNEDIIARHLLNHSFTINDQTTFDYIGSKYEVK